MTVKKKHPGGRPRTELSPELIFKLARIQCNLTEMAAVLGCHPDTLRDRYVDQIEQGREAGKLSLRRKQWKTAMTGNVVMMIWLGKQYLGQSEKVVATSDDGERPFKNLSDEELAKKLRGMNK